MTTPHKTCTKCGETKPLAEFRKDAKKRDSHRPQCKTCTREQDRRYHEENREKIAARKRRYHEKNREEINERRRRHHEKNREKENERKRRYNEEYREQINGRHRRNGGAKQSLTAALATVPLGTRWLPGEDALLMADNGMTIYQKAIELGRTYNSCASRRHHLRKKARQ